MDWLALFRPQQTAQQVEDLALEVAERSEAAVRARLGSQATRMNVAEAQGYVRARAGDAVRRETDVLLSATNNFPTRLRPALVRQAIDQTVALVASNLTENETSQPALRRAS